MPGAHGVPWGPVCWLYLCQVCFKDQPVAPINLTVGNETPGAHDMARPGLHPVHSSGLLSAASVPIDRRDLSGRASGMDDALADQASIRRQKSKLSACLPGHIDSGWRSFSFSSSSSPFFAADLWPSNSRHARRRRHIVRCKKGQGPFFPTLRLSTSHDRCSLELGAATTAQVELRRREKRAWVRWCVGAAESVVGLTADATYDVSQARAADCACKYSCSVGVTERSAKSQRYIYLSTHSSTMVLERGERRATGNTLAGLIDQAAQRPSGPGTHCRPHPPQACDPKLAATLSLRPNPTKPNWWLAATITQRDKTTTTHLPPHFHHIMATLLESDDQSSSWTNTDSGGATPADAQDIDFVTLGMFIIGMLPARTLALCVSSGPPCFFLLL